MEINGIIKDYKWQLLGLIKYGKNFISVDTERGILNLIKIIK